MSAINFQDFYKWLEQRNSNQTEFNQAVCDLFNDLLPLVEKNRTTKVSDFLEKLMVNEEK